LLLLSRKKHSSITLPLIGPERHRDVRIKISLTVHRTSSIVMLKLTRILSLSRLVVLLESTDKSRTSLDEQTSIDSRIKSVSMNNETSHEKMLLSEELSIKSAGTLRYKSRFANHRFLDWPWPPTMIITCEDRQFFCVGYTKLL
jgi:hypothetical protein